MISREFVAGAALTAIAMSTVPQRAWAAELGPALAPVGGQAAAPDSAQKPPKKRKTKTKAKDAPAPQPNPQPETAESQPQVSNQSGRLEGDIVVVGLRENVKSARSAKRNAQQIVDVVLAQDIGKLPDKNVPEALARVPGVQIERDRGEGGSIRIRGLDGAMTTINGSPTFSAGDRTTYLNDISSDLVAGIEVYKTRTADQVEGSQTGVVNLTLRRPTDFKSGTTYALSARGEYADRLRQWNPFLSALVAYNADTEVGKIGFSINGTYNKVRYNESLTYAGRPTIPRNPSQIIVPGTTPARIYIPYVAGFAGPNGWSQRVAFQFSTNWRPDDHWNFVLEGGLADQKMLWGDTQFVVPIVYPPNAVPLPVLSNIVMNGDGQLVKSLTLTSIDPQGPGRQSYLHNTRNKNGRFQVEYNSERFEFTGWVNYAMSNNKSDSLFHWLRFAQQPQVDIDFNDKTNALGGGVTINFAGTDLMDPKNYVYLDGFNQSKQYTFSHETEIKGDLKLYTFWRPIDWLKVGYRYANRSYERNYGERGYADLRIPLSILPNYVLSPANVNISSQAGSPNWLIGDSDTIRANLDTIRSLLVKIYPSLVDRYPAYNPAAFFTGSDGSLAAYGMLHYNAKLLFPIDGTIGMRFVNTLTNLRATQRVISQQLVDGRYQTVVTSTALSPKGNSLDMLPSVNAIIHFTPKLQLRTAWTRDIFRPNSYQINPSLTLNLLNTNAPTASGGNSNLRGTRQDKYDASLEWYFGATGTASLAVWQWDQEGRIFNRELLEYLPESPNIPVRVTRPYNLGKGRFRGLEGQLTTFFTFLPGVLKSFGGSVNGTLALTKSADPTYDSKGNVSFSYNPWNFVSKYTYNLIGFFEKDGLNVRVAYNWRSRQQIFADKSDPYNNIFLDPVSRLDASINYDVKRYLTVAIEGSNLLRDGNRSFWGTYDLPQDTRYFSRTINLSVRTRF